VRRTKRGAGAVAVGGGGESVRILRSAQRALVPALHARQPATAVVVAAALSDRS
jgi:hypothetical protein